MTLFDSVQNLIFGKKKSKNDIVENNTLGQISRIELNLDKNFNTEDNTEPSSNIELTSEDVKKAIRVQREEITKLKKRIYEYGKNLKKIEEQEKEINDNKKILDQRLREYEDLQKRNDLTVEGKRQVKETLTQINQSIRSTKEAEKKCREHIKELKKIIGEMEHAVKVNQEALSRNLKVLPIIEKSNDNIKVQKQDISELESEVIQEELLKQEITSDVNKPQSDKVNNLIQNSSDSSSENTLTDDDYWAKGRIT